MYLFFFLFFSFFLSVLYSPTSFLFGDSFMIIRHSHTSVAQGGLFIVEVNPQPFARRQCYDECQAFKAAKSSDNLKCFP